MWKIFKKKQSNIDCLVGGIPNQNTKIGKCIKTMSEKRFNEDEDEVYQDIIDNGDIYDIDLCHAMKKLPR